MCLLHSFSFAEEEHVLLKIKTSSKDERRARVGRDFEIVLLLGDNPGDFDGLFDNRSINYGKDLIYKKKEYFGSKYILFPNPVYGSWEGGVFPEGSPTRDQMMSKLRAY